MVCNLFVKLCYFLLYLVQLKNQPEMKKINILSGKALAAIFSVVLLGLLSINAVLSGEQAPKPIPDDVMKIFNNSCGKCHNQGGSGAALANVNFTKWDNYDAVKQAKKAEAICKVISSGKMPPKSFIKKNPLSELTDDQKSLICTWSKQ